MAPQVSMHDPLSDAQVLRAVAAGYVRDDVDEDIRETGILIHYDRADGPQGSFVIYRLWNEDGSGGVRLHVFPDRTECFTIDPDTGAIVGKF